VDSKPPFMLSRTMKTTPLVLAIVTLLQLLLATPSSAAPSGSGSSEDLNDIIVGGLPLPFGVGVNYLWQRGEYEVTDLHATPLPPGVSVGPGAIPKVQNHVDEVNVKLDWWALPWLNVHAVVGWADGHADASLSPDLAPLLGGASQFTVDYNGFIYGGGMTLAAGYKHIFGTFTANYTWGDIDLKNGTGLSFIDPDSIETLVLTPKVGWRFDQGAVWVGGFYQFTSYVQSGRFNLGPPLGVINFQASVEDKSPWNYVVGGEYKLFDHWNLMAEGGFGDRDQVLAGITYRF